MNLRRWILSLRTALLLIGAVAAGWGVLSTINGATQAPATVKVPVLLAAGSPAAGTSEVHLMVPGVDVPDGWFAAARPVGFSVGRVDGAVTLAAWDSTVSEQVLARGDLVVGGLGWLVAALAVSPVLASIADGRPFAPGNARRLVVLAVTVIVAGVVAPVLPQVAGWQVLERTGLAGPAFAGTVDLDLWPVLAGALVLALAVAFRTGEPGQTGSEQAPAPD